METTQNTEATPNQQRSFLEKALSVLKYPVAVVSGYIFAHHYASDAVYDKLVKSDKKLKEAHEKLNETTLVEEAGKKTFRSNYYGHDNNFQKEIANAMERNGYEKPWHLVEGLGKEQRWRTLGAFLSSASIALGVMMTIADNKSLMDKLSRKDKDAEQSR